MKPKFLSVTAVIALMLFGVSNAIELFLWQKSNYQGLAYLGEFMFLAAVEMLSFVVICSVIIFTINKKQKITWISLVSLAVLYILFNHPFNLIEESIEKTEEIQHEQEVEKEKEERENLKEKGKEVDFSILGIYEEGLTSEEERELTVSNASIDEVASWYEQIFIEKGYSVDRRDAESYTILESTGEKISSQRSVYINVETTDWIVELVLREDDEGSIIVSIK